MWASGKGVLGWTTGRFLMLKTEGPEDEVAAAEGGT